MAIRWLLYGADVAENKEGRMVLAESFIYVLVRGLAVDSSAR
jgi:hypothetical protein